MGIRLYNKMPTRIQQLDSFRDFKRKLRLFLLAHPFYLLNEFLFFFFNKNSVSAIDNIFIYTTNLDTYEVIPAMNGLSDHDAQIINLNVNTLYNNKSHEYQTYFKRNINKYTMAEFQNSLSYESWDEVFDGNDVNKI